MKYREYFILFKRKWALSYNCTLLAVYAGLGIFTSHSVFIASLVVLCYRAYSTSLLCVTTVVFTDPS